MSAHGGTPFEQSPGETALGYAKRALYEVGKLANEFKKLHTIVMGPKGLDAVVNHNARMSKKLKEDLEKEIADLKAELREVRLSAIISNPIMYDEQTRKAAQVELQAIMYAKASSNSLEGNTL